mmetsp:Transcript_59457/g.105762  ORF Transcript_59457/g.105762 Transcript_59457/m.105762 type:complete len:614 (-) Transcript_59457:325-2166(-)|eukprot:CAMPEP_0197624126 /NCGR_PEP_ID=MMETSP1338-20131121/3899_1 /TAXON_ID=43686 ORGANISM="Pelagodinium beii, Strain RCC1491" /NCGR_SAMPLE_ID=MMETSP1338 /ASSEMBLY_ACC=CAM_ASM_000754 /LENGTH=613 /DNA_ID=CAMNT_0043194225 /DNA_START=115 /DNA_END=1956 /DNA_ORIENTATION=+
MKKASLRRVSSPPPKQFRAVLVPQSQDPLINTELLSNQFQALLSQLAQQHLRELSEQRNDLLRFADKTVPVDAQIVISNLQKELANSRRKASTPVHGSPEKKTTFQIPTPLPPGQMPASPMNSLNSLEVSSNVGDDELPGMPDSDEEEAPSPRSEKSPSKRSPIAKEVEKEEEPEQIVTVEEEEDQSFYGKGRKFVSGVKCDLFIGALILINVLFMFLQCHYDGMEIGHNLMPNGTLYQDYPYWMDYPLTAEDSWPGMGDFLYYVDVCFTVAFTIDVTIKIIFLGLPFWCSFLNLLDVIVVALALYALADTSFQNPSYMRMLRLAKMGRLAGALAHSPAAQSLQMLLKCIASSVNTLGWSLCVLVVIQSMMGLMVSSLVQTLLEESSRRVREDPDGVLPEKVREDLFYFYGTFSKTIMTMFQILFANWIPCARVLIDNVSEAWTLVFIFYRCLVGFAVMSVISAVFVQSTMKVAQQDQDILIAQKQRDKEAMGKNLKKLFDEIDTSGDGNLSHDELMAVVNNPKMALFMNALEIDTKDLQTLFHLLDDGDGEISTDEFLGGIGRLRGPAKALDMAAVMSGMNKLDAAVQRIEEKVSPNKKKVASRKTVGLSIA